MKAALIALSVFSLLLCGIGVYAQGATDGNNGATPVTKPVRIKRVKPPKPEFHYPVKQFFFQGENVIGYDELGARFTAGYRFSQWAIVGAGVGVDGAFSGFSAHTVSDPYGGVYFPLYMHYSADILKKRTTPFYTLEAGYAFRTKGDESYIYVSGLNNPKYKFNGGFTGSVAFGAKFYPAKRVYVSVAAGLEVMQGYDKYSNSYYNSIGQYISVSYSSYNFFIMPGLKVAVGL